jgi:cephalosporin hydroxylase
LLEKTVHVIWFRVKELPGGKMTFKDDRADFDLSKRTNVARMSGDANLQNAAKSLLAQVDAHHWSYAWSWLGLPIIQTPEDIVVFQEIIWSAKPTLIIETGVARGGSLIFLASMLKLVGQGRVIGVELELRPHNRRAIFDHPISEGIEIIDGSSTADAVISQVRSRIKPEDRVMVILDSNHTHEHVYNELKQYAPLVTPGQYLIVCDTGVEDVPTQHYRPRPWGPGNNPSTALDAYLCENLKFERDSFLNNKLLLSGSRGGFLRRCS